MYWIAKLIGYHVLDDCRERNKGLKYAQKLQKLREKEGKPMKKELQDRLVRRFPYMYRGYYKDMKSTCMCGGLCVW